MSCVVSLWSIAIVQKNNGDDFPYIAICGQQDYVSQKIRNKLTGFPAGQLVVLGETENSIIHYNWLRERGCIEVNPKKFVISDSVNITLIRG